MEIATTTFLPQTSGRQVQLLKLATLILAGQWLFPGGGLPPSAQTGKWVVQMICKKEKQKFIVEK